MTEHEPYNVLFLCTRNAARSLIAEALLNKLGEGKFRAFSAGSNPTGTVNPHAIALLEQMHHPVAGLRSKSWDEFGGPDAPKMDFVFTLCDEAAGETCPVWPGHPVTAHWGFADPSRLENDGEHNEAEVAAEFGETYKDMRNLLSTFIALPHETLDRMSLQSHVDGMAADRAQARKA
jgi:arsenate reductase